MPYPQDSHRSWGMGERLIEVGSCSIAGSTFTQFGKLILNKFNQTLIKVVPGCGLRGVLETMLLYQNESDYI